MALSLDFSGLDKYRTGEILSSARVQTGSWAKRSLPSFPYSFLFLFLFPESQSCHWTDGIFAPPDAKPIKTRATGLVPKVREKLICSEQLGGEGGFC